MRKIILALCVVLVAACGGGGSSNSNLTGQFIDAPVQGLYYVSSTGVTGTTDARGTFEFKAGDTVTFKIGGANGLELAAVTPTPAENAQIKVADLPASSQIAQVLQTFGCPSGQDCSGTKLDLRRIAFTDAQKATLKDHFDSRGDLDTFATSAASLVAAVGTAAGKTFAPKTKADVIAHIEKADAKNPTTSFPSFGGALIVEEAGYISFVGVDVKNSKFELFDTQLSQNIGTLKQTSGKKIDINWTSYKPLLDSNGNLNSETYTPPAGCSASLEFKNILKNDSVFPYVFSTKLTTTSQCDGAEYISDNVKVIPIDDSFKIIDLVGKRLSITGAKDYLGVACTHEIAFDITSSDVVGQLNISPVQVDGDHPCGELNAYNLKVGETLSSIIKIGDKTPSLAEIETYSDFGSEIENSYEQFWIFKTKGLTPKLAIVYAGNLIFDDNFAATLSLYGPRIQNVNTVNFTITESPQLSAMAR